MRFDDDEGNLLDSELQGGMSLDASQLTMDFERLPSVDKGVSTTHEIQIAVRSQSFTLARIYEAQAQRADQLIRNIDSA